VRRYLLAVFACLSVFLIDATPAFTIVPTVIVYPLVASSATLDREVSARIVTTLATQIAVGGQIKVVPAKTGVERQNYLADARAAGANYYVTGFITPLGDGASVVEQVVSTSSGTLVFSVSNYISSYNEVVDQGDQLRQGIVDRSQRGLQAFTAPPQAAAPPQPEPSNGADVNVNNLFGRKKSGPAVVAAVPPAASATIAILTVGGSADSDARSAAAQALAAAVGADGRKAVVVSAVAPSSDVCNSNNATALIASWLETPAGAPKASLRTIAYNCDGKIAYDHTVQYDSGTPISLAANTAISGYLNPPKAR
jgi:TolB-like protein